MMMVRKLKKEEEVKNHDSTINLTIPIAGDNGQVQLLNGLSQGTSATTRIGNKVSFQAVYGKINIKAGNGEADGLVARVILVYDRRTNGTAAAWSGICAGAPTLTGYDLDNDKGKYQVLFDEIYTFNTNEFQRPIKFFIDLKGKRGDYSLGNAGSVADIAKGSLYLAVNTINNTVAVTVAGYIRCRYTDA